MTSRTQTLPQQRVSMTVLQGRNRTLVWGFDRQWFFADDENQPPREFGDVEISVEGLAPGPYVVEHWDCWSGTVLKRTELTVDRSGAAAVRLPPFRRDFALKIRPR